MDEYYTDCDGLCYDCEEFTWCPFSPYEITEEIDYINTINLQ